jgi:4a-hydroxytetrahydrobiopterin dehydratase
MLLEPREVKKKLSSYPDWEVGETGISKRFIFPSFLDALEFVNKVGTKSEKLGHHPDIDIRFKKVRISLTSHEEGGITEKDIKLARIIDDLT